MKKILTLTALGAILAASNAMASGFHLKEQSVSGMGNAFAGATAGAEDISFSYFNPAGLTRHKGSQIVFGTSYIAPNAKTKYSNAAIPGAPGNTNPGTWINQSGGHSGDIIKDAAVPNFYASKQINDDFTVAISMNTPFGMITKYDDNWAGRLHGTLSNVKTITFTPMIAYKVDEKVSIGAGVQAQYIKARLKNAVNIGAGPVTGGADLQGDTTDIGYMFGALYEYSKQTRFGVGYRSKIHHKLKGDVDITAPGGATIVSGRDINAEITTPALLSIGAYHDVNDKWSVMAELQRTYWESFDELRIKAASGTISQTDEKWKNTTFYAVGTSYKIDDAWKLKVGLGFDKSAVKKQYRTPRVPDSNRVWYSTGVQYNHSENLTFDVGYTFIKTAKTGKVVLDGLTPGDIAGGRGSLQADYKAYVHIVGVGATYRF